MVGLWSIAILLADFENFWFSKSVAQAALKCPKPLFSISLFKKSGALTINRHV